MARRPNERGKDSGKDQGQKAHGRELRRASGKECRNRSSGKAT